MNKINKLIKKIDTFCTQALCSFLLIKKAAPPQAFHMPDDDEEVSEDGSLLGNAEQFDIKNEDLFNQFESFMGAYKELLESLQIDPNNLDPEAFENAGQLIDTLNKRYERIMNNPYLNGGEDYEEDFNPGDFTQFIQEVVADAERQLKAIAGQDINIDEMRANQYAQEFNNTVIDTNDKNITWTGNKVQQNLEARKEWFKKLMFIKKVGKSHPEYQRYEGYIQSRRDYFKNFLDNLRQNNPTEFRAYQNKMNERVRKSYHKNIDKQRIKHKDKATKIREVKQSETLEGYITHLKQKLATQKSEAVKSVKSKAAKDPVFTPYKKAVADAKMAADKSPSPATKQALENAIRAEADALKNYLDNHPMVNKVKEDLALLYAFRDKANMISSQGWVTDEGIAPEVQPHLYQLIVEGNELVQQFEKFYKAPCGAIKTITKYIEGKL
jgi:hypothetical protein